MFKLVLILFVNWKQIFVVVNKLRRVHILTDDQVFDLRDVIQLVNENI